ncbi:Photosystem II 10 kDa polypeptide, chloroplastic [Dichanthelium oligosanthes]|uniref:Photosystem II 10 kDa polypeptide, chloroplastic n=1 Tax=Dichanthelium oligosanthes TaxID=888268 RepID=A0A1E5WJ75_9POAL|nr:Photosystem II 10 kDa polypeptide, chloroplastic [Dichanthelium oligosanthes]
MAASMISSSALVAPARAQGLPSLGRRASSFAVVCGTGKKIKTDKPFGIGGGLSVDVDASGRKVKGKGVYQFVDKYGANVDGYSPIYKEEDWSPTGDVYVGGTTGLLIWAITLAGLLGGGALLVYNTSALAS